jgi:hypothetical protein
MILAGLMICQIKQNIILVIQMNLLKNLSMSQYKKFVKINKNLKKRRKRKRRKKINKKNNYHKKMKIILIKQAIHQLIKSKKIFSLYSNLKRDQYQICLI